MTAIAWHLPAKWLMAAPLLVEGSSGPRWLASLLFSPPMHAGC